MRTILRGLRNNLDLVVLWWLLVALQPLLPRGAWLAREDLLPWLALVMSLGAFLRGRPIGEGPHPMLEGRKSGRDAVLVRMALMLVPWVLLGWYESSRLMAVGPLLWTLAGTLLLVLMLAGARDHERTAWVPAGTPAGLVWLALGVSWAAVGLMLGNIPDLVGERSVFRWMPAAALVGLGLLAQGVLAGRMRNLRQRLAAGRRDGKAWRPSFFRPLLAVLGSGIGLFLLLAALDRQIARVGYDEAFIAALHVVAWAAIIWPREVPVAMHCVLHEVVPVGGADDLGQGSATSFDRPPEGALRFHPLRMRRTRAIHPWLVPVQGARIDEFDDPVAALWERRPRPVAQHVLGEASFEPELGSRRAQWDRLTLRLGGQVDVTAVRGGDAQSRRIVVMRAFPPPGSSLRPGRSTYRWQRNVPAASLQIVDAATEELVLTDGSILILSTEGVARAWELEIGAPVYRWPLGGLFRPAQVEDHLA